MIFVTVGTQLAFDRMILVLNEWAASADEKVIAQIGPSELQPEHMQWSQFLSPQDFKQFTSEASIVVAHAGMGSILTAMQLQKPIIIMPRQLKYHEHRNDHQLATAKNFQGIEGIHVVMDEIELKKALDNSASFNSGSGVGPDAQDDLICTVRDFINDEGCSS